MRNQVKTDATYTWIPPKGVAQMPTFFKLYLASIETFGSKDDELLSSAQQLLWQLDHVTMRPSWGAALIGQAYKVTFDLSESVTVLEFRSRFTGAIQQTLLE